MSLFELATGGDILKFGIIADDITGSNDTGVQFARSGLRTSVLMSEQNDFQSEVDVLVIDTDSRGLSKEDAYQRLQKASEYLKKRNPNVVYKKIDSTLRGNIGIELEAVLECFTPDFIIVAPGYPKNDRTVENGRLFIKGKPLHESEFAHDPKNPIKDSYIPDILKEGTNRRIEVITSEDIHKGIGYIHEKMKQYYEQKVAYLVFDSQNEYELQKIVKYVNASKYQVVWSGSAGLANYLTENPNSYNQTNNLVLSETTKPILIVVGSVNKNSRIQLNNVLDDQEVVGIKLHSHLVVSDEATLEAEKTRVLVEVGKAVKQNANMVLYSTGNKEEILQAVLIGEGFGLSPQMVSEKISEVLGELTAEIISRHGIERLFLTGGDTAKKVCDSMGIVEFELIEEIEIGIPVGKLVHDKEILAITKAGGFGSENSIIDSLKFLKGENVKCAQLLE